jgi:hypothetical protein
MYSFYLAWLLSAAVIPVIYRRSRKYYSPDGRFYGQSALTIFCFSFCALVASLVINEYLPDKIVRGGPFDLVAMRSADGIDGNFVWGTGSINGEQLYNVMVKNDDGSLSPFHVRADSTVRIVEDSSLHGEGKWYQTTITHDYSAAMGKWALGENDARYLNKFVVPVGTVVQQFIVK